MRVSIRPGTRKTTDRIGYEGCGSAEHSKRSGQRLERRRGDVRFVQRHAHRLHGCGARPEIAASNRRDDAVEHDPRQKLGGRVPSRERRHVVEVAVVQLGEHPAQRLGRAPDVDDDAVGIELRPPELDVDDVGGAVQPLRGPEHVARKLCAIMMWSRTDTLYIESCQASGQPDLRLSLQ